MTPLSSIGGTKSIVEMYRDAEAEINRLREANRRLHRRVQASESRAAQLGADKFDALDAQLAECKVERHKLRNEVAFMKSERKRLKRQVAEAKRAE